MLREWIERNLEEPFFRVEMVKSRINIAGYADRSFWTIQALEVYGTIYIAFCAFWFAKYIAA